MKVPHSEGVAIHTDPESCACIHEGRREALTGEGAGQAIEPRKGCSSRVPTSCRRTEGNIRLVAIARRAWTLRGLRPWHVPKLLTREPGGLPFGLR